MSLPSSHYSRYPPLKTESLPLNTKIPSFHISPGKTLLYHASCSQLHPLFTITSLTAAADQHIFVSVFLAVFLPCAGMSAVLLIYVCLLWCATNYNQSDSGGAVKPVMKKGLSAAELEKLPKVARKELVMGIECAVCLGEIEEDQPARLVPGCNHGFHLQCADTWLSKHSVCPVCRAKLDPQFFNGSENPC